MPKPVISYLTSLLSTQLFNCLLSTLNGKSHGQFKCILSEVKLRTDLFPNSSSDLLLFTYAYFCSQHHTSKLYLESFFSSLFLLTLPATLVLCWPLQNPSNRSPFSSNPFSPQSILNLLVCTHPAKHPLCFSIPTQESLKHELDWTGPLCLGPALHLTVLCCPFPSSRTHLWASVLVLRVFSLPAVFLSFFYTWWAPSITV